MARTLYDILEVAPSASPETIRAAYVSLIKRYHPDVAGPEGLERSKQITSAYDVLKDPQQRAAYDASLRRGAANPGAEQDFTEPHPGAAEMVNIQSRQLAGIGIGTVAGHVFSALTFLLVFYPVREILGVFVSHYSGAFSFILSLAVGIAVGYAGWAAGLIASERYFYGPEYTFQTREAMLLRASLLRIASNPDILLGAFVFICAVRMVFFDGQVNSFSAQLGCAAG